MFGASFWSMCLIYNLNIISVMPILASNLYSLWRLYWSSELKEIPKFIYTYKARSSIILCLSFLIVTFSLL